MHPFNGRFHPIDYTALERLVQALVPRVDVERIDYVLGFPEGGSIPAYAFGRAVGRPVILTSRLPLDLPGRISFEQPGATWARRSTSMGSAPAIARWYSRMS